MKKMILLFTILCLVGLTSSAFAEMIVNAGFETQDGSTPPAPWTTFNPFGVGTYSNDSSVIHSGSWSIAITNPSMVTGIKQDITSGFDTSTAYQFTAWIYKTSVTIAPQIAWWAYNAAGEQLGSGQSATDTTPINEWTQITSGDAFYLPTETAKITVKFQNVTFNSTGTLYFDDVSSEVVPEPSSLLALFGGLVGAGGMILRRKR